MDETTGPVLRTSVVMVSRNCVDQLRRCLTSIDLTAGRETLQVIVVDNGSQDGSGQLDQEFPATNFLRLPKNFGQTKALNIGIRGAKGEFVLLLEPYFEFVSDAIPQLVARLERDVEAGAVCPYTPEGWSLPSIEALKAEWVSGMRPPDVRVPADSDPVAVEYPRGSPLLIRRTFLAGMRNLDQRYGDYGWDIDLCTRVTEAGKKVLVLPHVRINPLPRPEPSMDTVATADRANGAAAYIGKYHRFAAGLHFRLSAILYALTHRPSLVPALISGQKVDGEQPDS